MNSIPIFLGSRVQFAWIIGLLLENGYEFKAATKNGAGVDPYTVYTLRVRAPESHRIRQALALWGTPYEALASNFL